MSKIKESKTSSQGSLFHGSTAFPGLAKGKIAKVKTKKDLAKVKKGNVILINEIGLDYLPIIKKAGAIISEQGGISCHAAILSREFKIPCVIGLKKAGRIFHDGDRVEVDAKEGTVRII